MYKRQVGQGVFLVRLYHGHQPLGLRHFLLAEVLLQDNQVTAHLRARVGREQVVGQAYRGDQIGLTEQLVTHGGLGAIQYPLRGDELSLIHIYRSNISSSWLHTNSLYSSFIYVWEQTG